MLLERVRDLSGIEVPEDPFYAGREAKAISNALAVADDRAPWFTPQTWAYRNLDSNAD